MDSRLKAHKRKRWPLLGRRFGLLLVVKILPNGFCRVKCKCGRRKILWKAMFTSPLVFAPLWSAFQDAGMTLTSLKYGVFVVAFENGFFWKEFFDNRRQRHP
jgi:hypothetical protein